MSTQPTNNAVPSESPRDLKFNAGKIDEFVTSLALQYIDRFGKAHYTIEGLRKLAQEAISAFGWIPLDSFQDGATLTLPNQVLRWKKPEGDGEYYRWDGVFPKSVPAGSTPDSSGGVTEGAWISVGDAALRAMLASSADGEGDALIAVKQAGEGAIARTQHDKNAEIPSLKDYGAKCDGVTNDLAAFVALKAAYPTGDFYTPSLTIIGKTKLPAGRHSIMVRKFASLMGGGLIANANFDSSASGWSLASGWTFSAASGGLPNRISHLTAGISSATTSIHLKAKTSYLVRANISVSASGIINFKLGSKNIFGSEIAWQESGTAQPGFWIDSVVNPNGSATEQIHGVSSTEWIFSFRTDSSVDGSNAEADVPFEISTAATGTFRGEISKIQVFEIDALQTPRGLIPADAENIWDIYGPKISADGGYNVLGYGDDQCLQLINADQGTTSDGAHNVAFGPRTGATLISGDENAFFGAMSGQWATGSGSTGLGYSALKFSIKGMENTAVGYKSGVTSAYVTGLTAMGFRSSFFNRNGNYVVALGHKANERNLQGSYQTNVGTSAGFNDGGNFSTALGYQTGAFIGGGGANNFDGTTAVGALAKTFGNNNTSIGYNAHVGSYNTTTGSTTQYTNGTAVGVNASAQQNGVAVGSNANSTGNYGIAIGESAAALGSAGVAVGLQAGLNLTGSNNISVGSGAGKYTAATPYENTTCIGSNAVVTGSNQVQLGGPGTSPYAYANLQLRSDARDKADVVDSELGIDFILGLKPKQGYYDFRDSYSEWVNTEVTNQETGEVTIQSELVHHAKDGSKKQDQLTHWFIAQEVEDLCKSMGVEFGGLRHNTPGDGRDDVYSLSYEQFVPPITQAIQSCWARMDELEARIKNIGG